MLRGRYDSSCKTDFPKVELFFCGLSGTRVPLRLVAVICSVPFHALSMCFLVFIVGGFRERVFFCSQHNVCQLVLDEADAFKSRTFSLSVSEIGMALCCAKKKKGCRKCPLHWTCADRRYADRCLLASFLLGIYVYEKQTTDVFFF